MSTDYGRDGYLLSTTTEVSPDNATSLSSNQTLGFKLSEDDPFQLPFVQFIFSVFYVIIFLLGMFGNFLVIFVVARTRTMQTVTNFFISNLAVADILLCCFCITLTPTYTFLGRWIFGTFLCHLVAFLQCCCVYLSTLTLTAIAIDRFFVIIFPFRPRMKLCTCIFILCVVWIFAIMLTSPYGYYMEIVDQVIDSQEVMLCDESWPTEDIRKLFGTVTSILQFFLPFLIILICYLCIFCKLQNNKKKVSKSKNSKKKQNCEKILRKKTSTNQMLVLMVGIFGVCWLPLNIINILDDFNLNLNDSPYYNLLFFTSHLVAMSSVIYNPFLYAWLNENFRKEFKQILPCLFVNISTHRELKNPKNFLSSLSRGKKNDGNLIRNGEKTIQETTFLQANNENVMISIETDMNHCDANHKDVNDEGNFSANSANQTTSDKNNLIVKGCYEMASSSTSTISPKTSTSQTQDTSIS